VAKEVEAATRGGSGDLGGGGAQHLLHRRLLRAHIAEEGHWLAAAAAAVWGRWVAQVWSVLRRPRTAQPRAGLGRTGRLGFKTSID
jgi:hypothetical protein